MPNTSALGGNLAVSATDVWITDFNNDVVWRDHLSTGQFTSFSVTDPPRRYRRGRGRQRLVHAAR